MADSSVYVYRLICGPTQVEHWANMLRIWFAGSLVYEGTETVWVMSPYILSVYDVPSIPLWIKRDLRFHSTQPTNTFNSL